MSVPKPLKIFWRKWRALAVKLGRFNGIVVLTLLYWSVIAVVSVLFLLSRHDPLDRRWRKRRSTLFTKQLRADKIDDYQHIY